MFDFEGNFEEEDLEKKEHAPTPCFGELIEE